MKGDLFKGVVKWDVIARDSKTKKQHEFHIPIFYYDSSAITAIYSASTKLVRQYLPDPRMYPLEISRGRCSVALSACEYRNTDIGAYNEFSIAFLISFDKKPLPALSLMRQTYKKNFDMYIRHMPVTTEIARMGGVELAGFPKILANIDISRDRNLNRCTVNEKKKHILSLEGPVIPVKPGSLVNYRMFFIYKGTTIKGNALFLNHQIGETRKTDGVKLTLGDDHPIARELKAIDLGEKAISYQYIPSYELILFGPRNLVEC